MIFYVNQIKVYLFKYDLAKKNARKSGHFVHNFNKIYFAVFLDDVAADQIISPNAILFMKSAIL